MEYANMACKESSIFVNLDDENTLGLLLRTPEEFMASGTFGAAYVRDETDLANQYTMAASLLIDATAEKGVAWMYTYPILFLYRHAIELHIKGVVKSHIPIHDLAKLSDRLKTQIQSDYGLDIEGWITETIKEFSDFDPRSTAFRYVRDKLGQLPSEREYEVDLKKVRQKLGPLFRFFWIMRMAKGKSGSSDSQQ
jgi:hypothetical protein